MWKTVLVILSAVLLMSFRALSQDIYLFDVVDRNQVPDSIFDQNQINSFDDNITLTLPGWETRWVYFIRFRPFDFLIGPSLVTAMDWPEDPDSTTVMQYGFCRGILRVRSSGDTLYTLNCTDSELRYFFSDMSASFSTRGNTYIDWTVAPIVNYAYSFDAGLQPKYGFFLQGVDSLIHPPIVSDTKEYDSNQLKLELSPNPVSDYLRFSLDEKSTTRFYTVAIYDSSGKLQYSDRIESISINEPLDISFLTSGIYHVYLAPILGEPYTASFVKL